MPATDSNAVLVFWLTALAHMDVMLALETPNAPGLCPGSPNQDAFR